MQTQKALTNRPLEGTFTLARTAAASASLLARRTSLFMARLKPRAAADIELRDMIYEKGSRAHCQVESNHPTLPRRHEQHAVHVHEKSGDAVNPDSCRWNRRSRARTRVVTSGAFCSCSNHFTSQKIGNQSKFTEIPSSSFDPYPPILI